MKRRYRPSQKLAVPYVRREDHPAVWMQMRLGKCMVTIRRCKMYIPRNPAQGLRVLIVGPNSALGGWEEELEKEGENDFLVLHGTTKQKREQLQQYRTWTIINKEAHLHLPELTEIEWDAVILDESTFIKNPKAKVTKFFTKNFRDVPHRWSLTGYPNPEGDLDLFCQLQFLYNSAFGCRNYWQFRAKFFKRKRFGFGFVPVLNAQSKIKKFLAEKVFVLRRKDVNMDVPKVFEKRIVHLPQNLRETYNALESEMLLEIDNDEKKRTKYAPVAFAWLRQLCDGFVDDELVWSGKFNALEELLTTELAGEPVVVWFSYNKALMHAYDRLQKLGITCSYTRGKIKPIERRKREKAFRAGKFRVFLAQVKVADSGMNLSNSDTSIYFSPPAGTMAWVQSMDRILETSKAGPLLITNLLVSDSVDTAALEVLQDKEFRGNQVMSRVFTLRQKARAHNEPA